LMSSLRKKHGIICESRHHAYPPPQELEQMKLFA
jgi:hypothetical protein